MQLNLFIKYNNFYMIQKKQIKLSRATSKVRHKIIQLLVKQDAHPEYKPLDGYYQVDMHISSESKQILDQIITALTETISEQQQKMNQYSFSRVLDPLEIYENNIQTTINQEKINFTILQNKIELTVDEAVNQVRENILSKYEKKSKDKYVSKQDFVKFMSSQITNLQNNNPEDSQKKKKKILKVKKERDQGLKVSIQKQNTQNLIEYFRNIAKN